MTKNKNKTVPKKKTTDKITFSIDKETNFNDWFNEIIKLSELVDMRYGVKGFIVYREWSTISIKKIFTCFEDLLDYDGHSPTIFPVVIPESNFEIEKDHVAGFTPEVMWVTETSSGKFEERLAMRPTSETAMYPMYSLWIKSHRDLPLKLYQSGPVWRYETKATKPFVRGREFWWIEAHDVFTSEQNAIDQVQSDLNISKEVIKEQLGVPILQFQRPQWDKFAGADETFVSDAILPNGRFLQLPSTHLLGQRFAKAFDIKYLDENNDEQIAYQTCYGPGITRIYGAVVATHGDNSGLILPFLIAPVQAIIVPIFRKGVPIDEIVAKAKDIKQKLRKKGIRIEIDESDRRPGDKYFFWEMKGVPFRIELGAREVESNEFTVVSRDNRDKNKVKQDDLYDYLHSEGAKMLERITQSAWDRVKNLIVEADDMETLTKFIVDGKVAKIPYCSMDFDGQECAETIKAESGGADVRGRIVENIDDVFENKDKVKIGLSCLGCGKPAKLYVYCGKQY